MCRSYVAFRLFPLVCIMIAPTCMHVLHDGHSFLQQRSLCKQNKISEAKSKKDRALLLQYVVTRSWFLRWIARLLPWTGCCPFLCTTTVLSVLQSIQLKKKTVLYRKDRKMESSKRWNSNPENISEEFEKVSCKRLKKIAKRTDTLLISADEIDINSGNTEPSLHLDTR